MPQADLLVLDVAAAAGDANAARLARWMERHPRGAQCPEDAAHEALLHEAAA